MLKNKFVHLMIWGLLIILALWEGILIWQPSSNNTLTSTSTKGTIQLVHNPWDTEVASSTVLALVLEEAGYQVNLISVDNAIMFESVAKGESDLMTSAWLPITHGEILKSYQNDVIDLGANLTGARSGLVVPSYMTIDSIDDLTTQANQTIMGIEAGAGIMLQTEEALSSYSNLSNWQLESPSTGAMLTELKTAIDQQEEIIITGWTPHWKFQQYDLKYLDDPQNIYGDSESIHTLTRKGFEEDFPEAYHIADNFNWTVADMESITLSMQNGTEPRVAAKEWIENNRDIVSQWLQ